MVRFDAHGDSEQRNHLPDHHPRLLLRERHFVDVGLPTHSFPISRVSRKAETIRRSPNVLTLHVCSGSNPSARRLQSFLPWLPLPPAVGLRGQETTQQVTVVYEETPVTFSPMSMASSSMGTPIIQLEMDRKDTDSW